MIGHVCERGHRLRGLIEYLYGPGDLDVHTNPHLVAAWDSTLLDSAQDMAGRGQITAEMMAPRRLLGVEVPGGPVYHVVCSIGADEGQIGDEAWRKVAERAADKLGFTAREGRAGCRWIAVHHGQSKEGNDHIHFVVEPVREDGLLAELGGDWFALGEMATEMERELGLKVLVRNKHGERGVKRSELAVAQRRERPEPDRTALARRVRAAAAGARTEAEFLTRLRRDGVLIRPRWVAGQRAQRLEHVVGYSVAVRPTSGAAHAPGRRESPIWYGGGKLGRDLSLPALRQRWGTPTPGDEAAAVGLWRPAGWRREPAARIVRERVLAPRAWEVAGEQVAETRRRLGGIAADDRAGWASAARESAGVLAAVAGRLQPGQRGELARAADALARAGQLPRGEQRGYRSPGLEAVSGVARVATDAVLVGYGGSLATMILLRQLAELAGEIGRAHDACARAGEARAAADAAEQALAYVHAVSQNLETLTLAASGVHTAPARTHDGAPRPARRRSGLGARPTRARQQQPGREERGRGG